MDKSRCHHGIQYIGDNLKYLFLEKEVKNLKLLKLEISCVYEKLEIPSALIILSLRYFLHKRIHAVGIHYKLNHVIFRKIA